MHLVKIIILIFCGGVMQSLFAQDNKQLLADTSLLTSSKKNGKDTPGIISKPDTLAKKKHSPQKATVRSAIIPGWGQAYNNQFWKIPIVYTAVGIPAGLFVYNNKWYKKTRDAYNIKVNEDTAHYGDIDPKLQDLSPQSLQFYRNEFRKNKDYCVLFFLIAWGLNIVDATVSGHLKGFDVSDNLSLHVEPHYNPSLKTAGLGFVFSFKDHTHHAVADF